MNTTMKIIGAVGAAALVVAGGSAYTASNTVPTSVAGYGTNTVTGATASAVTHTLDATGENIVSTALTFSASVENRTVKAGFGSAPLEACVVGITPFMSVTCTYATPIDVSGSVAFNVAVS